MKPQDEEIKKSLEEFQNRILKTNLSYHIFESEMMAVANALDLISRQQAENERLKSLCTSKDVIIKEQQAEIENLKILQQKKQLMQ